MIKVAIVGCGKIADLHAAQLRRVSGCRMVAACDREELMAAQLAERFAIPGCYTDVARLLDETKPDIVHITTPPQSHFQIARQCLEAGSHVYLEKPFTVHLQEAEDLVALAEKRGLKLTVGHNVQFGPEMIRMRDLVKSGFLGGPPVHMESIFSYNLGDASYVKALLGDKKHWVRALPGKLLQNLISHGIAKIAEFLQADRFTVSAQGLTSPLLRSAGESEIIDELRVIVSGDEKTTAYFTFTTQISPPVQEFRLFGPKGSIHVDNLHRTVVQHDTSNSDFKSYLNFFVPPFKTARQHGRNLRRNIWAFLKADFHMDVGMKNLIDAFQKAVRNDGPPPIPHREILATASIMEEIFRQLENADGRTTPVDDCSREKGGAKNKENQYA